MSAHEVIEGDVLKVSEVEHLARCRNVGVEVAMLVVDPHLSPESVSVKACHHRLPRMHDEFRASHCCVVARFLDPVPQVRDQQRGSRSAAAAEAATNAAATRAAVTMRPSAYAGPLSFRVVFISSPPEVQRSRTRIGEKGTVRRTPYLF